MGDPRRKHKKYAKPRKRFETSRIKQEDFLLKKYGLKNKRELWRVEFKIDKIRRQAKSLINNQEQQAKLIGKLKMLGFEVNAIDDILALTKENLLDRMLQTMLVKKGFARTPREARQFITHKHVIVAGNIVNIPSFLVPVTLEEKITISKKEKQKGKQHIEIKTDKNSPQYEIKTDKTPHNKED